MLLAFRRACIIQYGQDALLAIVTPDVGNGPLNVLMEQYPGECTEMQPGAPVEVQATRFRLGTLAVSLGGADTWEARPDWELLRAGRETLLAQLELVLGLIDEDVRLRFAYYTSDTPLEEHATLASNLTPAQGVPAVYGITRAMLRRIFAD